MDQSAPDIDTAVERTSILARIKAWLRERLWLVVTGVCLALAGVVADRFSDEGYAWLRSIFWGGIGNPMGIC
jgi:hypothetical protein